MGGIVLGYSQKWTLFRMFRGSHFIALVHYPRCPSDLPGSLASQWENRISQPKKSNPSTGHSEKDSFCYSHINMILKINEAGYLGGSVG